jgi:predicted Zn-dependent protease
MPRRLSVSVKPLLLIALLVLSACETAEERAERYYRSGITLLEAGDVDRALVEFRNVFKLNGQHKEARLAYARVQRERGETRDAYGQYLRLIEQYPDTLEALVALSEMALVNGDWDEAERHGRAAQALAPQDIAVQAIGVALDYRAAVVAEDDAAAAAATAAARAVLEKAPDNMLARRVVIDQLTTAGLTADALAEVDRAMAFLPDSLELHMLRLRLLAVSEDTAAIGAQLQDMFARFPDNEQVRTLLIAWYMEQEDTDGAERLLRQVAEKDPGQPGPWLTLVRFLYQTRGLEAAQAELDRLIAAGGDRMALYRATRAGLTFEVNQDPAAIAEMETILREAPPSEETRNIKLALAQMLAVTGNTVGARARVEEVLAEDSGNAEALKMKAAWLIQEDKPGEAIVALRTALDQNPRDPAILTLMGEAHERDGSRELAGERYALAVEVSGYGVEESLRYANYLIGENRLDSAASVLEDALRRTPGTVALLVSLADVRMRLGDWDRTSAAIADLRALGTEDAARAANGLEAGLMLRQEKTDETVAFLQGLIDSGSDDGAAVATIVQARVRDGDLTEARSYLDAELAKTPDDTQLRLLSAGLFVLQDDPVSAEQIYTELVEELPQDEAPVRALYSLLLWQNRPAEATILLDAALQRIPDSTLLRVMRAGELEKANDIDGAIAIYEAIYAEDSSNLVIANNLASLIAAHRSDPASLERAFSIARRLRGIEVPAFQDTYGWIEYRRGNPEEALLSLEPAARGLPQDPLVQYHLGMTYVALDQPVQARAALERALEIAGESPLPQFDEARKILETLPGGG